MDRLEHDLRRLLESERWALPYDGGLVARARAGAARRRRARRSGAIAALAAAATAAVVLTATALGPAPARPAVPANQPTAGTGLIPWIDTAPPPPAEPAAPSPRPTAAPCRSSDLHLSDVTREGAGGHNGYFIAVRNDGPGRCTLSGYPALGAQTFGTPRSIENDTFFDVPQSQERPATVEPGELAYVTLESSQSCDSPQFELRDVELLLDSAGRLPLGVDLITTCAIRVGPWHLDASLSEPADRFDGIQASIEDVGSARHGAVLDYVVVLRNDGAEPITLEPCPGYTQELAVTGGKATGAYQLNCPTVRTLGPGKAARFAMRLGIPASAEPAAKVLLRWRLLGSAVEAQIYVAVG
jgi:Domain of unknown function (DUF4232)